MYNLRHGVSGTPHVDYRGMPKERIGLYWYLKSPEPQSCYHDVSAHFVASVLLS